MPESTQKKGPGRPKKSMTQDSDEKPKVMHQTAEPKIKRVFDGQTEIYHDLFKLECATMMKDVSWSSVPDYQKIEHCHFFHSVDSSGRKHFYSAAVGGHFHLMEVEPGKTPEEPPKVSCKSGPLKFVQKKNRRTGKFEKLAVPVNEDDVHTHEVTYIKSSKIQKRKPNAEAAKVIGIDAMKTSKPKDLDVR